MEEYNIDLKEVEKGGAHYEFRVDGRVFEPQQESEKQQIKGASLVVVVDAKKKGLSFLFDFRIEGEVVVECDRCLDDCTLEVEAEDRLEVRVAQADMDQELIYNGEVLWIAPEDQTVDVSHYIYETTMLSLPYKKVHQDDQQGNSTCNQDVLSKMNLISEQEYEQISSKEDVVQNEGMDRKALETLQKIKDKMSKKQK